MCNTIKDNTINSSLVDDNRILKNKRISETRKSTRIKRKSQVVKTIEVKIVNNKLSKIQKEKLELLFLEAKWFKNDIVSYTTTNDVKDYDTKIRTVQVRMGKDSDVYDERQLKVLTASSKQKILDDFISNIKALKTQKNNGRKTGKIGYVKEVNSIPLKQYGKDYRINGSFVSISKIGRVRVRGLDQLSQGADISNAQLLKKPNGYYLHITTYYPITVDNTIMSDHCGLDFGIKDHITTSDGEKFNTLVPESPRLKKLQRKLTLQVKGSHNYVRNLVEIKKEYQKISNKKDDAANKIVHYLLSKYNTIYMQDENISGWHSGLFGKQVQHSILGRVKAKLVSNPRVIVLDRSVPTTQYCPDCGVLNKHSLDRRVYECSCGYFKDRDIHAACNMIVLGQYDNCIKR